MDTGSLSNNQSSLRDTIDDDGIDTIEDPEAISGLSEEILDVVQNDNTAGQRVFLTRAV